MARITTEFRVGVLTLSVLAGVGWAILATDDKPGESGEPYFIYVDFPTAEGVFRTTPVRIAGVIVGHVEDLQLRGGVAHLTLAILDDVELPADSVAAMKSEGMLGDKSIKIVPGVATEVLRAGDTIRIGDMPPDLEGVTRKVNDIAGDVKVITANIREITDNDATRADLELTIRNVRELSEQLNGIAHNNSDDIAIIAQNLKDVSEALKAVVDSTGKDVDEEMAAVKAATEKLDASLAHIESITAGIERGEGTVGQLLKDTKTIDSVNDTLEQVNGLVGNATQIRTEVYYRGDVFFGSDPTDGSLAENPIAGGARNGVGVRLMPAEDHWYVFELAGHPQGDISSETHVFPDFGSSYQEVVVKPGYRMTFQFARRWNDAVLRFGIKDNAGAVGFDYYLADDKFMLGADLFDFAYGSYPLLDGTPNLQLTARWLPWRHLYFEGGLDSVIMGAQHGYVTGYAGGGFYFDDQDVKFILAALPLKP